MIVIYHKNGKATQVWDQKTAQSLAHSVMNVVDLMFEIAKNHPDRLLIWCAESVKENLNVTGLDAIFYHNKMMVSYAPGNNFLPETVGFVEDSSFINVNKKVRFATWRMSSISGGIHASTLNHLKGNISTDKNFDYFLNSLAKCAMPLGLCCYSDPSLLLDSKKMKHAPKAGNLLLFRFIKQHYKTAWVGFALLNMVIYEKRFPFIPAFLSLFYESRKGNKSAIDSIKMVSKHTDTPNKSLDVIIPTIGRKQYLYEVLKDLAAQTVLPNKIIIVEQNPEPNSVSQLDYLASESWPFNIKHIFIHQSGACNARNLALAEIENDWVFFADDDIRLKPNFIADMFEKIAENPNAIYNICCLLEGQKKVSAAMHQTSIFATGCSFATRKSLGDTKFNMGYEFGFGEDLDFGMQLSNKGHDIWYLPEPEILHLKAPVGGFRNKPVLAWDHETIQPKPSPTIMLYRLTHHSREQILGYKTLLFFNFYRSQSIKNPIAYLGNFRKRWHKSIFWAKFLKNKNSA